jgi:cbb3-type cytochrome oxidase subunit 3
MSKLIGIVQLTLWHKVSALIFMLLFIGLVINTFKKSRKSYFENKATLPILED